MNTIEMKSLWQLERIARLSLNQNVRQMTSGSYLTAGGRQFNSLWTRDFCFSAAGLFRLGNFQVVHDQLELIISRLEIGDGFALVPKVLDSSPFSRRVRTISPTIKKYFGTFPKLPLDEPLQAEYEDERGSVAVDSNMLVLLTAHDYLEVAGADNWWKKRLSDLVQIYKYYDQDGIRDGDGLIIQLPFSDWQDSARRAGKTFYTNLLYYLVSERLAIFPEFHVTPNKLDQLRSAMEDRFFDKDLGIYRSIAASEATRGLGGDYPHFSLDANLLAIDLGYFENDPDPNRAKQVYARLKESTLWRGRADLPGYVTWPRYPREWIYWLVRAALLSGYHDEIYWSWLIALSAKVAWKMNDRGEASRIVTQLVSLAERDQSIVEIYSPKPDLAPFSSWFYDAERPFSWGAAFVLDLIGEIAGKPLVIPDERQHLAYS